eukprot:Blabericola_migrator_1__2261@NODE_1625_length_4143_cov_95_086114_g1058_i0_p2_GENE_NODE_1625_length_4143_cov_95_086114_g1058_i0NODE_1625_length_4143_cov_95_086114_g1058_i0_p2_ORF_typecomplete_len542_score62_35_NODE_1625_length_4143_cov_95_086114_g1058_i01271752
MLNPPRGGPRYSGSGLGPIPAVISPSTGQAWVGEDDQFDSPDVVSPGSPPQKDNWRRHLRKQPEDIGHWLCWRSRQAGCMAISCLFMTVLILGGLSYALIQALTANKASTSPELSKISKVLQAETGRAGEYHLAAASYTPQNHRDLTHGSTICDSLHFSLEHKEAQNKHDRNNTLHRYYSQLMLVHSHWAEAFARHCFLPLALADVKESPDHPHAAYRAAGYLNALALEGSLVTSDGNFPWMLYMPITTVPSNLFYGLHDLISLISIGLNKRVAMLDRVCFHDEKDSGCAGNSKHGIINGTHRPDGVDKIAMMIPMVPQMDGPPAISPSSSFVFQPSRLAGWFTEIVHRAAEVGTASADPLGWAAEHVLGVTEETLQKLSLNPATEHNWQSACHGGDIIISRSPILTDHSKIPWLQTVTEEWFPPGAELESNEPTHIVFICSRVLESQPCQYDEPDPMLKFTCGDFGANLIGCEESVNALSHEFAECRSLIPELMDKERERFKRHWRMHRVRHPHDLNNHIPGMPESSAQTGPHDLKRKTH